MTVRFGDTFLMRAEVASLESADALSLLYASYHWVHANDGRGLVGKQHLPLVCRQVNEPETAAAELVESGAWHDSSFDCGSENCLGTADAPGWVVHNYLKDNPAQAVPEPAEAPEQADPEPKPRKPAKGRRSAAAVAMNHAKWHQDGDRVKGWSPHCGLCPDTDPRSYPQAPDRSPDRSRNRSRPMPRPIVQPISQPMDNRSTDSFDDDFDLDLNHHQSPGQPPSAGQARTTATDAGTDAATDKPTDRSTDEPMTDPADDRGTDQRARRRGIDPADPGQIRTVTNALAKRLGHPPTTEQAVDVLVVIQDRVPGSGASVVSPDAYIRTAIAEEKNLPKLLNPYADMTLTEVIGDFEDPGGTAGKHHYQPGPYNRCTECDMPPANAAKHIQETRTA